MPAHGAPPSASRRYVASGGTHRSPLPQDRGAALGQTPGPLAPTRRDGGLDHARQLRLPFPLPARLRPRRRRHPAHRHRRPGSQRRLRAGHGPGVRRGGRRADRLPGADAHRLLDRGHPAAGHPPRRGGGGAGRDRRGVGGPVAGAGRRPAGAGPQPHPQRGGGRAPRAAAGRGAQVVPADLPRVLRAPPDRAGRRPARHDPPRRRRRAVRARPAVRRRRRAELRPARRGVRGHVGAGATERDRGAGRGDRAGEPVGQPDHHRARGVALPAGAVGVGPVPRGLRLRRGRRGRVVHGPRLGRPDHDLGERQPARRHRAVPERPAALRRRRRPGPAAGRTAADGHLRRQPARLRRAHRPLPHRRVPARPARRRPGAAPRAGAVPVRARRPVAAGAGLLRGLQHPGVGPGAADAGDRAPQARHRRVRRPRLDPRPDRRRPGDGPRGPAAQRHHRVRPCPGSPPEPGPRGTRCA